MNEILRRETDETAYSGSHIRSVTMLETEPRSLDSQASIQDTTPCCLSRTTVGSVFYWKTKWIRWIPDVNQNHQLLNYFAMRDFSIFFYFGTGRDLNKQESSQFKMDYYATWSHSYFSVYRKDFIRLLWNSSQLLHISPWGLYLCNIG